jgi:two-component system chemotaxis sensor kinase CheA
VRVPAERLDELMNRVGELVIAQSRLAQLSAGKGVVDAGTLRACPRTSSAFRRIARHHHGHAHDAGGNLRRFRRLIHDLAHETGKTIELVTEGEATEVDKTVIERLADPMIHMIRNSCDHGLKPATNACWRENRRRDASPCRRDRRAAKC